MDKHYRRNSRRRYRDNAIPTPEKGIVTIKASEYETSIFKSCQVYIRA
jgi:hypothetical protein